MNDDVKGQIADLMFDIWYRLKIEPWMTDKRNIRFWREKLVNSLQRLEILSQKARHLTELQVLLLGASHMPYI